MELADTLKLKFMNNSKNFEDTWFWTILVFLAVPAILITGQDENYHTLNEKLAIVSLVYLVNFIISLIYAAVSVPKNNFKKRMDVLRTTLLISSIIISSPFILFFSIRELYYRLVNKTNM